MILSLFTCKHYPEKMLIKEKKESLKKRKTLRGIKKVLDLVQIVFKMD